MVRQDVGVKKYAVRHADASATLEIMNKLQTLRVPDGGDGREQKLQQQVDSSGRYWGRTSDLTRVRRTL